MKTFHTEWELDIYIYILNCKSRLKIVVPSIWDTSKISCCKLFSICTCYLWVLINWPLKGWQHTWLLVNGPGKGFWSYVSRPHKAQNTMPEPFGRITKFGLASLVFSHANSRQVRIAAGYSPPWNWYCCIFDSSAGKKSILKSTWTVFFSYLYGVSTCMYAYMDGLQIFHQLLLY